MLKPFCDVCGKLIEKPFEGIDIALSSRRPSEAAANLCVILKESGDFDLCMVCAFDKIQAARQRCFAPPAEEAE